MSLDKASVKRLIGEREGLTTEQKKALRILLNSDTIKLDSVVSQNQLLPNGELVEVIEDMASFLPNTVGIQSTVQLEKMEAEAQRKETMKSVLVRYWNCSESPIPFRYSPNSVEWEDLREFIESKFPGSFDRNKTLKVYALTSPKLWATRQRVVVRDGYILKEQLAILSECKEDGAGLYFSMDISPETSPTEKTANGKSKKGRRNRRQEIVATAVDVVDSLSNSSRGSAQREFHDCVLLRDGSQCWFCGLTDVDQLEAAHLYQYSTSERGEAYSAKEQVELFDMLSVQNVNNGVTLCKMCHTIFDHHLIYVDVSNDKDTKMYSLRVADAVLYDPFYGKYFKPLNSKSLTAPANPKWFPVDELFKYRQRQYDTAKASRDLIQGKKKFSCSCSRRFETLRGLQAHKNSRVCG